MSFTKTTRPATSFSKAARPLSVMAGRFASGTFGSARFGQTGGFTKNARPTTNFAKLART